MSYCAVWTNPHEYLVPVHQPVSGQRKANYRPGTTAPQAARRKGRVLHAALYSIRPWAYYRINEGVRIDAAPLAYYILYPTLQYPASNPAAPTYEYRSTVGISRHRIMHRLWITDRTLWEYRNFSHGNGILRGRARLGLQYNLGKGPKVMAQEELPFNLHGVPASHVFEHSRFSLSLQIPIGSRLHAEAGYMHANRLLLQQTELQKEHNIFLHITIDFTSTDEI